MKMKLKDLRIDTFRNEESKEVAVKVVHMPTGFVAECNEFEEELRNRKKAIRMLSELLKGIK